MTGMKRGRFTEDQIIGILREQEAVSGVADVCRKDGMSAATVCAWESKCGGLDVSDAERPKAREAENAKLRCLFADATLDSEPLSAIGPRRMASAPKDLPGKEW